MYFAFAFLNGIREVSDSIYELCNRAAGHYWLLDSLIALPLYNQFVKGALLGGCFLAVWFTHQGEGAAARNRRILLVTLMASCVVVAVNRTISSHVFRPRPFVESQRIYRLEGDHLVEKHVLPYRVPLDSESQRRYRELREGNVTANDLDAFPSDHAAFYVTIAAGVMLVSPTMGWIAMAWTLLVVLGSRVIVGQHAPFDIAAGALLGASILLAFQFVFGRWLKPVMDPVARWTLRHQAVATLLVFMLLFEVSNTLQDVDSLVETGAAIARYFGVG